MQDPANEKQLSFVESALLAMFACVIVIVGGALVVWAVSVWGQPALYVIGSGVGLLVLSAIAAGALG